MTDPSSALVASLVAATADRVSAGGLGGVVALSLGGVAAVVDLADGRVVGPSSATPEVQLTLTGPQHEAWRAGTLSLAEAYMKGDLKPEGSTRALAAALEVLDDPHVRSRI